MRMASGLSRSVMCMYGCEILMSRGVQDIAARMEKDAVEAEKAIKDKVESVTKPETIPIPGPHNSKTIPLPDKPGPAPSPHLSGSTSFIGPVQPGTSNIPLPKTACFQKIGPNDPLVFQVGCVKH